MKSQPYRLAAGGRIDRSKPIRLRFNGQEISAYAGDTVASALLANGVHRVGRSFKYHRPRGVFSHSCEEPNALLNVCRGPGRADPNSRATVTEAVDGLVLRSQNHWPSLRFDVGAVSDLLSPFFVAGFYYKTFMWPRVFWDKVYEPLIRAAAGLGVAPTEPDPDRYAHRHAHCDVLVVGAGPTGLAAALAASGNGKRVVVVDEQMEFGGALLHDTCSQIDGMSASQWLKQSVGTLESRANVTLLSRATAFGYYHYNHVAVAERVGDHVPATLSTLPRERLWQIRAREVVLATGAHERPLVFANNDRPGIMLSESIQAYVNRFAVAPGRRIVVATNGASAYRVAADVSASGLPVTLVDGRSDDACGAELAMLRATGVSVYTGHTVLGSTGRHRVTGLIVAPIEPSGRIGKRFTVPCDCVGLSGGWTPAAHLFSQSRGRLRFEESIDAFVPGRSVQGERSAGACNGVYDLAACLNEGWQAGLAASGGAGVRTFDVSPPTLHGFKPMRALPTDGDPARERAFIDFQNDVTANDIRLAVREGFESVEHVKRYTTAGMATDQGKTSNMNALGLLAETLRCPVPEVGTTTFRPPYTPVTFGALAGSSRGALFEPVRTTPIHDWCVARGAELENVGAWRRAWYFPKPGEDMHTAVRRECAAVRASVGVFDASTLGKIKVVGPDAVEFLNRMYVNDWSTLRPGTCRYGLMLKEDGYILDDGIVARLAPDRFHVTTTTGGAARVLSFMEDYLQTEWPQLKVFLTSITEQWAVIAVQGPNARKVLEPLTSDIDLSPAAFPHMTVRVGRVCGVPARVFRASFTGELGYEVNVPAHYGRAVWDAICDCGEPFDISPYGTEAMHVLRAERGFIIIGQETDGTVTPADVGLDWMIGKAKSDFVGKRSLARSDLLRTDRKQLVGLLTSSPGLVLEEGAQIVPDPRQRVPMKSLGHVTSSYWSAACGRSIALALVSAGRTLHGTTLFVTTASGFTPARVTESAFVDPKGTRLHD